MPKVAETEIAAKVVDWLRSQHWEVYQEVGTGYANPVADIVAVCGHLHWIVACKTTLSLALLDQALWWRSYGHYVSIATPMSKRRNWRAGATVHFVLRHNGIGSLRVNTDDYGEPVYQSIEPRLFRKALTMKHYLREEQKTWAPAGNANGSRWTPFAQTCRNLVAYVYGHCGCTIKDVMPHLEHHYRSDGVAKSCLNQWLSQGVVKGIECTCDTRPRRLHVIPCRCNGEDHDADDA